MSLLILLLLSCLTLISSMPLRPQHGQPVIHRNHYNRVPHFRGLHGLQQHILASTTTKPPTTKPPTTKPPTTKPPTTTIPTTKAPTTPTPTTKAPTTQAPTTQAPTTKPTQPIATQPPTQAATLTPTPPPTLSPDKSAPGSNGLPYTGGPVMTAPVKVYLVYYGTWNTTDELAAIGIINTFVTNLGTSAWWNIQTTYYQPDPTTGARAYVQNGVTLGGYVVTGIDNANGGIDLTDANVNTIISIEIGNGHLPYDINGVYFMVSSSEVMETGFCSWDCGWHSATYVSNTNNIIKYGWVGDATIRCPAACTAFSGATIAPNGNKAADSIISVLAHEIAEAVSDPYMNAWLDPNYNENADKCAWNFMTTYTSANGGLANIKVGALDYLVQSNWKNRDGGGCVLHL